LNLGTFKLGTWFKKSSEEEKPKTLGQIGEEIAQEEYKKKGFKIIAKNEYNKKGRRLGEIDFIAKDKSDVYHKYQVTLSLSDENKTRELSSFYSSDHYLNKMNNILLSMDEYDEMIHIDECIISKKYLLKLPHFKVLYFTGCKISTKFPVLMSIFSPSGSLC